MNIFRTSKFSEKWCDFVICAIICCTHGRIEDNNLWSIIASNRTVDLCCPELKTLVYFEMKLWKIQRKPFYIARWIILYAPFFSVVKYFRTRLEVINSDLRKVAFLMTSCHSWPVCSIFKFCLYFVSPQDPSLQRMHDVYCTNCGHDEAVFFLVRKESIIKLIAIWWC